MERHNHNPQWRVSNFEENYDEHTIQFNVAHQRPFHLGSRISAVTGGKAMPRAGTKLALFIDGINTHAAARALGFDIDYKRLLTEFRSRGTLVRAFYYTAVIEDHESSAVRHLLDWLDYNSFTVVT